MDTIPLIRASQYVSFFELLKKHGVTKSYLLSKVNLPSTLFDKPNVLVPEFPLWLMLDEASRRTGNEHLGLDVGSDSEFALLGELGPYVLKRSITLYDLVRYFCKFANRHTTTNRFWFTEMEDEVWLCRNARTDIKVGRWQMEQYFLMLMVQLVRQTQRPDWLPVKVRCQHQQGNIDKLLKVFGPSQFLFGQDTTAIAIPVEILHMPVYSDRRADLPKIDLGIFDLSKKQIVKGFPHSLREAIKPFVDIECHDIDISNISEIVGIKPRTLQRRLTQHGLSYSKVVAEVRFEKASRMLQKQKNVSIIDIAYSLGYSEPSHFTRAFRRWSGLSPRAYREQQAMALS